MSKSPNTPLLVNNYFIVIQNTGSAEAKNIRLEFKPISEDQRLPKGLDVVRTIPILAPGIKIRYLILLGYDDPPEFNGIWSWENPNGELITRESFLKIPR